MITISRLQNYFRERMRRGSQITDIPNFKVFMGTNEGGMIAVPDIAQIDDFSESQAALLALISSAYGLLSVSFIKEYAPSLSDVLLEAGWIASHHVPVMYCALENQVPQPDANDLVISILNHNTSLEEIKLAMDVNAAGFAPDAEPTTNDEAWDFREGMGNSKVFLARYGGKPAATGMYAAIIEGVAEPLGITTLPAYRNLGIGASLVSAMTRSAYMDGASWVIAQAFTPVIENLYLQVGYQQIATRVIYRLPELVSA